MSWIQKELERSHSNSLLQKEKAIREELDEVLSHEKLLWKQKSKYDWLKLEDKNTKKKSIVPCIEGRLIVSMLFATQKGIGYTIQIRSKMKLLNIFKTYMRKNQVK